MTDLTIEELKKREKKFQAVYNKWILYSKPSKKLMKQYVKVKHRFEYYAGKVAALCENALTKQLGEGKYYVVQTKHEYPVQLVMFNNETQFYINIECTLDQIEKGLFDILREDSVPQYDDLITLVPKGIGELTLSNI